MRAPAADPTRDGTRSRAIGASSAFVAVGLLFGIASSAANHAPEWNVLAKTIGVGWSWAALGILVGAGARRHRARTVLAVLVAAVAGYYVADLLAGTYDAIDFDSPLVATDPGNAPHILAWEDAVADFLYWAAFAVIVSWPLARIGAALHRPGIPGLLARLTIPLGAAVEMLVLRLPGELAAQPDAVTVGTYVVVAALGLAVALVLIARHILRTTRRPGIPPLPGKRT